MFSHQAMQREGGHFSTDFHMPGFDGFEGHKDIEQGFELHDIMSENNGDMFYMTKENHMNVSQYPESAMTPLVDQTTSNNNDHNVVIHGGYSDNSGFEITKQGKSNNVELQKDEEHNINDVMSMPSRKIRWSGPLHMRFLKAINIIGLQKLTPKKVLKLMNVPDLTRRNVASHLQKYRLFLKRFADKNYPELKDREAALNAAFLKTTPVLNSKQRSSDISIPYPLSFFRTLLEWKRTSFADFTDGFSEPVYIHPSVTSSANNRGSTNNVSCGPRNRGTHSNGAVLPPMQYHDKNVSCGPRNRGTHSNGAVLPPMQYHDQNVSCGPRNHASSFSLNPNNNGYSEPIYTDPSVTSFASNRGSTNNISCGPRDSGTHSNGAVVPPMQYHDQNVSCGPRNHATSFSLNPNNNGFSEPIYIDPLVASSASNDGSTNNISCGPRNRGTHYRGAVLPPMQNHDQNVSCGPRNHAIPFNPNPISSGMTNFFKPPQVYGNETVFGSDQGKLGEQDIYKLNEFESSYFDTANGATIFSDHIAIPSTELGQTNFSSNITQEEQLFGSFSAVDNDMLFPEQGLGLLAPSLEPGPISTSVIGAGPVTPPQSQPLKGVCDDDEMWTDEFVASLLDDIRPLLED